MCSKYQVNLELHIMQIGWVFIIVVSKVAKPSWYLLLVIACVNFCLVLVSSFHDIKMLTSVPLGICQIHLGGCSSWKKPGRTSFFLHNIPFTKSRKFLIWLKLPYFCFHWSSTSTDHCYLSFLSWFLLLHYD